MKILRWGLVALIGLGILGAVLQDDVPSAVSAANVTIWQELHENIYKAPKCENISTGVSDIWFVKCSATKDSPNHALFGIKVLSSDSDTVSYIVFNANGKAMIYSKRFSSLRTVDLYYNGEHPDVEKALKEFRSKE